MPVELNPKPAAASPADPGEPTVVKRDYDNLDSLLSELNQPKQKIGPKPGEAAPDPAHPEQPITASGNAAPWDEQAEPFDPEKAKRSGLRLAKTIDGALSLGASVYAKEKDRSKYAASHGEIDDLAEPLAELSSKYNFELSPEARLIFLLVTIYSPKFLKAANDRRINELNDKVKDLEASAKRQEERLHDLEIKAATKEKETLKTE